MSVFDKILLDGIRKGHVPAREKKSREWFREQAGKVSTTGMQIKEQSGDRMRSSMGIGRMYFFFYLAKHRKTLPYYDRFPLIFPFRVFKGGFMGLNLHYLPPPLRAKLMDALYEITNNKRYDESTRLKLSYNLLANAAQYKAFRPCVKQYLRKQMGSKLIRVEASEWDIALFLPVEQFNAPIRSVWKDSRDIISGKRKGPRNVKRTSNAPRSVKRKKKAK